MALTPSELHDRAATLEGLLEGRTIGMARLLRDYPIRLSIPAGYDGRLEMCGDHVNSVPILTSPERLATHLLIEHAAEVTGVDVCEICESDFGTEVRTAIVAVTREPLVGCPVEGGEPVPVLGQFRVNPFAKICAACAVLWAEDPTDPIVIKI